MQKSLLREMAPRLRKLDRGEYSRLYSKNGRRYATSIHMLVGSILDSLGIAFEQDKPVVGVRADFAVGERLVFINRRLSRDESNRIARSGKKCILITSSKKRSDRADSGVRVVEFGGDDERLQTIFLDDPSFNFDYAHILPKTEKCSVMHGHTSSALVEIIGVPKDGMVVDFNDAKPIIKEAIRGFDHKLFISRRYVVGEDRARIDLSFETVHGSFKVSAPRQTTVLLEGEASVENMAQELLGRIVPKMPKNVEAVGVYVYEGLNKGTHLLAQIHRREAERRRKP